MITLQQGDCLEIMRSIPDGSVDMILCDLPYGTTQNKWDSVIPFAPLWEQYKRVAKPNAAIVLTASQPFTSALVMSNPKMFRYDWCWRKTLKTGNLNAKRQPLRAHESVLVFYCKPPTYAPQGIRNGASPGGKVSRSKNYGRMSGNYTQTHTGYPDTVITVSNPNHRSLHPTQKPVALMEYMIRTYTNEGETVLDNCMGSGTTGVACIRAGRKFIGIEKDAEYFAKASERINGLLI